MKEWNAGLRLVVPTARREYWGKKRKQTILIGKDAFKPIIPLLHHFYPACPVSPRGNTGTRPADLTEVKLFFYFTGAIIPIGAKPLSSIGDGVVIIEKDIV
jgi:hypothetical protein